MWNVCSSCCGAHGQHKSNERIDPIAADACDLLNHKGQTAVHAAVLGEKPAAIKYILKTPQLAGLVNEADNEGSTPLHLAAFKQNTNIMEAFARDGKVDKTATNDHDSKAVEIFLGDNIELVTFGRDKVLRLLGRSIGVPIFQQYIRRDFMKLESSEEKKATSTTTIANDKPAKVLLDEAKKFDTDLLVAMLIATVTFSAALTMPGGFNSNGMAILHKKLFFVVFVLSDTISFLLALFVVFNHFMVSNVSRIILATPSVFIRYSIAAMVVAFASGMFMVLPKYSPLGIFVVLVSCPLCYMIIRKIKYAGLPTKRQIKTRYWLRSRLI